MIKLLKTSVVLALLLLTFGCKQQEVVTKSGKSKSSLNKTAGQCVCATRQRSSCNDECTRNFMNDLDMRRFKITWESCDNNDLNGGCRGVSAAENPGTGLPYTSEVLFCYSDWVASSECTLLMQIDFLPPCIKCITGFPRCIKFRPYCSPVDNGDGTTTYTLSLVADDEDVSNGTEVNGYQVTLTTISGDPKIKICCEKVVGNFKTFYCCTGDLQPL